MFDLQKSNLRLLYSVWSESKSQEDAQKWLKVTVSEASDLSTGSFSSPETHHHHPWGGSHARSAATPSASYKPPVSRRLQSCHGSDRVFSLVELDGPDGAVPGVCNGFSEFL